MIEFEKAFNRIGSETQDIAFGLIIEMDSQDVTSNKNANAIMNIEKHLTYSNCSSSRILRSDK